MIRTCTDAWAGVLFNVFLKHVVSQNFLHYGFRILLYETRTRTMTTDYFQIKDSYVQWRTLFQKSSSLNKRKRLQTKTRFQNWILEHFLKIVQKISLNLSKLVLKITPSKPLINFKYAIIKGEYKKKNVPNSCRICLSLQKAFY